jgi:prepilin-type N-terminal cleavage/methylation domain-containing protein
MSKKISIGLLKRAFTLLEMIIAIIIIGVLASLALPRMFRVIECSKAVEATSMFASMRTQMERSYLMNDWCDGFVADEGFDAGEFAGPGSTFSYTVWAYAFFKGAGFPPNFPEEYQPRVGRHATEMNGCVVIARSKADSADRIFFFHDSEGIVTYGEGLYNQCFKK